MTPPALGRGRDGSEEGGRGLLGVILAGGRSTRFGSGKASADMAGRSMLARALDALEPWVAERGVVLAASPAADPRPLPPVPVRRDGVEGLGPLEGLRVALSWARETGRAGVVVLACDLPLLGPESVGALVRAWASRPDDAPDGVVPVVEGRLQPLAAVYGTAVLDAVEARLAAGSLSLGGLVDDLRVARLPAAAAGLAPRRFLNVNTPEDGARVRTLLSEEEG